jgi:hypothetical protein
MAHSYDGSALNSTSLVSPLDDESEDWKVGWLPEALRAYSPHAANASLNARSPGAPFSIAMMARRWLV